MDPIQGASTGIYLATNSKVIENFGGEFFFKKQVWKSNKIIENQKKRIELMNESQKIYQQFF